LNSNILNNNLNDTRSIGEVLRILDITSAAISLLLVYLKKQGKAA